MKLWQKIFISTLLLVILAVDVTAVLLLTNNHRLAVERERERSASEHAYITAYLMDYVLYTRLRDNGILLNEEETLAAVRSALQTGGKKGIAIKIILLRFADGYNGENACFC